MSSSEMSPMSGDLPNVATRIFDHPASIAVGQILRLFERYGAGFQRTLIHRVDVLDIEVEKGRHRVAGPNAAYHDERAPILITDGMSVRKSPIASNACLRNSTSL